MRRSSLCSRCIASAGLIGAVVAAGHRTPASTRASRAGLDEFLCGQLLGHCTPEEAAVASAESAAAEAAERADEIAMQPEEAPAEEL